jgi:competence protein ComEA
VQTPAPQSAEARVLVNLNTATLTQLETLPGVGPQTAARIKEYREKNGGFKKVEELMKIKGIGEKAFLKLRGLVVAAPQPAEGGTGGRQ